MKIMELKSKSQVFTLKDGKTLRIFAHQVKKVADSNVSNELKIAESMGLVKLIKDSTEVPKNKKSGGTK
jgi:hypothetical protein